MKTILKGIYQLLIIVGMILAGNNTIILKDMEGRVDNLSISKNIKTELKTADAEAHSEISIKR